MRKNPKNLGEMDPLFPNGDLTADSLFPEWLLDVETQAVIIAGLCCVGAWVIFQWIIQIMFSVLWPFFVVVGVLVFVPSWRKVFAKDYLPKHIQAIRSFSRRLTAGFNSSYTA